eukprot:1935325-Ditylum_brightwellii.AAC.1
MSSFLRIRLATLVVRALIRSIADDTLDTLNASGDRQILKVAHCMHVVILLLDHLINLVLYKIIDILDLCGA